MESVGRSGFGFSWTVAVSPRNAPFGAIGFPWISLDSLRPKSRLFNGLRGIFRKKNFSPPFAAPGRRLGQLAPAVLACRGSVMGTSVARFLIFCNQLSSDENCLTPRIIGAPVAFDRPNPKATRARVGSMSASVSTRNSLWPGVPLALASAVLFGASTPFAKLLRRHRSIPSSWLVFSIWERALDWRSVRLRASSLAFGARKRRYGVLMRPG